ncbi:diguanylate cyclase [Halarcobacter ebronensis]|uniref:diguanylate cyclase n=1 Tax=Halarcobacter ebronensis TaxID=1462615 RepID=A0A4Q1APD2_9BACT|nr:diguanylate cyclase [Halarcobacter ebronensis]QKF80993.1 diguanylate cyclase (CBS domains) [Halarcobacter ebronensis]RXK06307.1 hypothetical protein CRV07_06310 [Halarcobacter ebronensis]
MKTIPSVYEIAVTDVITVDMDKTLNEAIERMALSNLRTIVIINQEENTFHILTTVMLLNFKIFNIDKSTPLKDLSIPQAKELDKNLNLLTVLNYIDFSDEYMVITDKNKLVGIVSYTDIVNNIDPQFLMEKQTIFSLIHQYKAVTTKKENSTFKVINLMKDYNSDSVVIVDEKQNPIGIFTTKDFIHIIHNDYDLEKPVSNYMNSPVETLSDDTTIAEAINFIKMKHYKRVVVVNKKNQVMGIITQKELLRVVYSKWVEIIKEEGAKISKTNEQLLKATNELKEKVSLDYLTKIYNRNKFEELLDLYISNYKKDQKISFSLLMIDIDNFKLLNDTFGHLFGDNILKEMSKILTSSSRNSDVVARWGGEEFVIILPNTTLKQAVAVAEKLKTKIEKHQFENEHKITCSFGVAHFNKTDNKTELFRRADEALYKAKKSGKNRVEVEQL